MGNRLFVFMLASLYSLLKNELETEAPFNKELQNSLFKV